MTAWDEPYAAMPRDMRRFKLEQKAALLSCDVATFRAFMKKYNPDMNNIISQMSDLQVLRSLHLARLQADFITDEQKEESRFWLREHGFRDNWDGVL